MAYTFISGATGGIGRAFCLECASRGNDLFITGRSLGKISAIKNEILSKYSVNIEFFPCDLSKERDRKKMIDYIDQKEIKFDRMIMVAGVDTQKAFADYTMEKVLFQMRVNVEATISLTHNLLERIENKAEILVVSSMSGATPMPYFALYSATKAMLTNFYTALHYELKKEGVKVTVVTPGGVYTRPDIVEDIERQGLWGRLSAKTPKFVAERSLKALKKNKVKYIPGFFNKLLNVIVKITPKKIVLSFIAKRWKKQTKDAF